MSRLGLMFAWTVCILLTSRGRAKSNQCICTSVFSHSLLGLANSKLGVRYMQGDYIPNVGLNLALVPDYYNTLQYSQQQKDASDIALDLARDTSELFLTHKVALERLKVKVENIYADGKFVTTGRLECCNAQNLTDNYEFIAPISKETSCDRVSAIAGPSPPSIYNLLNNIYRKNDHAPLKWQYFGSEFGVANQFPAVRAPDCGSYDPRFRPWYISTATPNPKDVVLVIKNNARILSYEGRLRLFAAADIILRTLNPRDRVAMVLFNKAILKPAISGCYATNLSLATPANIRKFQNFLETAPNPCSGNNVSLALRTAYQYFCSEEKIEGARRERAILLFTDGERIDSLQEIDEIKGLLKHYTTSLNFNITLFIFTTSDPDFRITPEVQKFYKGLISTVLNTTASTRYYIELPTTGDLRQNMADFYSSFAATAQQTDQFAPVINVPYLDVFGLNQLVITISVPCYANFVGPKLVGVAAVDLTLSDLLAGVEYFREGELSYAFVIDSEGFVLFHPLLPSPSGNDSAVYLDISTLEPQPMFSLVREAMIGGGSGCMVLNTTQVLSRGSTILDGARTVVIPSNYCWAPVEGTPFSLCVVIPLDTHLKELSTGPFQIPISAHYHRLDVLANDDQLCSHLSHRATTAYSTVSLSPEAFARPDMYILAEETNDSVLYTQEALTTLMDVKQVFRRGILQSVAATAEADNIWLNGSLLDSEHIAWRYIATSNGVFRVYPGIQLATKEFNALQRLWYQQAVAHLGLLSISPPYDDGFGAGKIVSLSQAILPPDCVGLDADRSFCGVLAVMGMDMTHAYFTNLLHRDISLCSESSKYMCLLIDSNAYLVSHPYFTAEPKTGEISYHHLAELEPLIARDMVGMSYLQRVYCNNFQYNADFTKRPRRQYSYEVTEKVISAKEPLEGGYSTLCTFYQVAPIVGTNVFLIVVELVRSSHGRCAPIDCPCDPDQPCSRLPTDCTCPCSQDIPPTNYNPCLESFNGLSASACPTRFGLEDLESPIAGIPTEGTLPMCFEPTCDPRYDQVECLSILGCEYCNCIEMPLAECRLEGTCPTCMDASNSTQRFDCTDRDEVIMWQAIAGAMLALAVLLACLLVTLAGLCARERIERKKQRLNFAIGKPRQQLNSPTGSLSSTSKEKGTLPSSPTRSDSHSIRNRQLNGPKEVFHLPDIDASSCPTTEAGPSPETEESNLPETDGSFSNIFGTSPNPSNAGGIWF